MDHASAHERIADLALETGGFERLESSRAAEDRALMDHIHGCDACQADVVASRALSDGLRLALADLPMAASVEPISAPEALRVAILDAAHREREARGRVPARALPAPSAPARPRRAWLDWSRPRWAAGLAAALTIALLGGVAGSQWGLSQGNGGDSVVEVVATLNRVLAADTHRVVPLRTASGAAAGSVAWSRQDFVVLASTLTKPAAGRTYRCWLRWAGVSTAIGTMKFAGDTAYWSGSVGDWAAVAFESGTQFIVTLEADGDTVPSSPTTPAVLVADLGP